jgi:murein DD-endopeptidase MepM/ murein hydrolase activator NlpD
LSLDWPVRGDILRRFGPVGLGERNNGVNIGAAAGTEVRAAAAGRVGYVGDDLAGQGLTVLIVHRDGWRTVYGHLGTATVRDGDLISAGGQIGTVGNTAGDGRPSIHFETWRESVPLSSSHAYFSSRNSTLMQSSVKKSLTSYSRFLSSCIVAAYEMTFRASCRDANVATTKGLFPRYCSPAASIVHA